MKVIAAKGVDKRANAIPQHYFVCEIKKNQLHKEKTTVRVWTLKAKIIKIVFLFLLFTFNQIQMY